ncbi:hypothetical protein ES707_21830 [subsurface metagenome]
MKTKPLDGRVKRTYHLETYQVEALKTLSEKTRIKQVDFIREAVDDLILKYQKDLPNDLTKNVKEKVHKE